MIGNVRLNTGATMPQIGLGVFALDHESTAAVVHRAIEVGYRSIDTAASYGNEAGVAEGIRRSGIDRSELFLTTKLWNDAHASSAEAFERSLERLDIDWVDLYLIHWPMSAEGRYLEAWSGLEAIAASGRSRSIGVSNFNAQQLREVIATGGSVPAVNQIEIHPYNTQEARRSLHSELGVVTEAWSPLARGVVFKDTVLTEIASGYGVSVAQLVLRWHLECGVVAIPKASSEARLRENFDVMSFELLPEHRYAISALDSGLVVEESYYVNS